LGIATAMATGIAWLALQGVHHIIPSDHKLVALLRLALIGLVDVGAMYVIARAMRIEEITDVVATVRRRIGR